MIHFESLLSNEPYEHIRVKYFGKRKKQTHPAYKLSPNQLKAIGWQEVKRENYETFRKRKNEVIINWEVHEFEELSKHYALFILIEHFPKETEKKAYNQWFIETCRKSNVDKLNEKIIQQWKIGKKEKWAEQGLQIARAAYKISKENCDFEYKNLFVNVLFVHELLKNRKRKSPI